MRSIKLKVAMTLAVALAAPSCGNNRVETQIALPPAADRKAEAEPVYPVAALEPCPTNLRTDPCPAEEAERRWWGDLLIWGREHYGRVARICLWAYELEQDVPAGYCPKL